MDMTDAVRRRTTKPGRRQILELAIALATIFFSLLEIGTLISTHTAAGSRILPAVLEETFSTKQQHQRPTRVLIGIFSADTNPDLRYRRKFRELFGIDPRVCSLASFINRKNEVGGHIQCELIYTFVVGANNDGPTELVDNSFPILVERPIKDEAITADLNNDDMTLLNIKENMNDGKSQTWLWYGSQVAEEYEIDYIAKTDTDTLIYLDQYFDFARNSLPPRPGNRQVMAGFLCDKWWWKGRQDFCCVSS
jgi:hypothetical protein